MRRVGFLVALAFFAVPAMLGAGERSFILASTTSTENSGLFRHILPIFRARAGIRADVVAVGSGAAIALGERGDADVLLVHDPEAEERFVAEGHGVDRRPVMCNDFVLVGPRADPAGIAGGRDVAAALAAIAGAGAPFYSRGDDSGTHRAERRLWRAASVDPAEGSGRWYFETGAGLGATLNTAAAGDGYALSDRGTWIAFRNRRDLALLVEGDPHLYNPYSVILVNPARQPHVKAAEGRAFIDWITSEDGQRAIGEFRIEGEQLFFPAAAAGGVCSRGEAR